MHGRTDPPAEQAPRTAPQSRRAKSGVIRSIALPILLIVFIVGGLWYWDSRGGGVSRSGGAFGIVELAEAKNPTGRSPAPEVGRAGPDFLLETPQGGTLRLSDLQGQPVLINFWATWCPPCRAEMPELVAAYETHQEHGLVIVGVDLQETNSQVLEFADEFGIVFPLVIDRNGEVADAWRLGGPIEGIPTSYFLDETGVIRAFFYGPMTAESLEDRLEEILPD